MCTVHVFDCYVYNGCLLCDCWICFQNSGAFKTLQKTYSSFKAKNRVFPNEIVIRQIICMCYELSHQRTNKCLLTDTDRGNSEITTWAFLNRITSVASQSVHTCRPKSARVVGTFIDVCCKKYDRKLYKGILIIIYACMHVY